MAYNASLANSMEMQGIPSSGGITTLADPYVEFFSRPTQSTPVEQPIYTGPTVEQLYQDVLGRASDTGGLQHWTETFGDVITPDEIELFKSAAQPELAVTGYRSPAPLSRPTPPPPPPVYTGPTVEQLYQDVLGRGSDPGGLQNWTQRFGATIDPNEIAEFRSAAAPELVNRAYQNVLGRAAEDTGAKYFTEQLQTGALSAQDLANALAYGAQGLDRLAAQKYLGQDIYAPSEFLTKTSGMSYQDLVNYLYTNVGDPVRVAQLAAKYNINPSEIISAKQAIGVQDIPTIQVLQDYLAQGRAGLGTRIQDIITSTIGGINTAPTVESLYQNTLGRNPTPAEIEPWKQKFGSKIDQSEIDEFVRVAQAEKLDAKYNKPLTTADLISLTEGALKPSDVKLSSFTPESLANKSIEEIEKLILESPTNKQQEANRIRNIAEDVYGFSADKAKQLQSDLIAGKDTDDFLEKLYGDLLKGGYNKDLQTKILQDAAIRSPGSKYFKENPEQLLYFTPIGERKNVGENSNQYGIDPKTGLPLIHLDAANRTLETGEVFVRPFREEKGQGELGYNPHSAYAGFLARGVGIFGAKAGQSDIDYFDNIEKEIDKLGGVRTETTTDPETGQQYTRNYVITGQETDPETGQKYSRKVNVENLFYQGEDETKPNRTYQEYLNTQNALRTAAEKAGISQTKYTSTKQAYEDLNNRFKDFYVIQGRTDTLDPAAAKTLGIPDVKENSKHATLLYQVVGDKLIPFTDPKTGQPQTVLKTFDFKDPNTTRGFFGDLVGAAGSLLSIPPIALAFSMAGGLPGLFTGTLGTAGAASAASALANQIGTSLGFEGATANVIGKSLLQGGSSALMTGIRGGNLDQALTSGLAGLVGAGVSGGVPIALGDFAKDLNISPAVLKTAGEVLGGTAARGVTGQDSGQYAMNRLLGLGIGALTNMGAEKVGLPTKSSQAEIFKAMLPIISNRNVRPEDVTNLAKVLQKSRYLQD